MYDYEIRNEELDSSALFKKWPEMKSKVLACVNAADRDGLLTYYDDDIGYFLALLKLLVASKANFHEIVGKFIIFSNVSFDKKKFFNSVNAKLHRIYIVSLQEMNEDPKHIMDKANTHPHFVAMGEVKSKIKCFYIMFEEQYILVRLRCLFTSIHFN